MFWNKYWPIMVISGLTAGLFAQFIWKMIYFPEPIIPVILELIGIIALAGLAVWGELRH